jgi:cytochrome c-type biogenesis protein CcmE
MSILLVASLGVLAVLLLSPGLTPYLRADELLGQKERFSGIELRVAGRLRGPFARTSGGLARFAIAAGNATLEIECTDTVPPALADGTAVLLDGALRSDGVFHAHRLLTECSSRYSDRLEGAADRPARAASGSTP